MKLNIPLYGFSFNGTFPTLFEYLHEDILFLWRYSYNDFLTFFTDYFTLTNLFNGLAYKK
jgi:hypothetical protein